jgi:hypothetical protein
MGPLVMGPNEDETFLYLLGNPCIRSIVSDQYSLNLNPDPGPDPGILMNHDPDQDRDKDFDDKVFIKLIIVTFLIKNRHFGYVFLNPCKGSSGLQR